MPMFYSFMVPELTAKGYSGLKWVIYIETKKEFIWCGMPLTLQAGDVKVNNVKKTTL